MFITLTIFWYIIGLVSFIFWWTNDTDLVMGELPIALLASIMGPIAFIVGYFIHGDSNSRVIFKQRK